MIAILTILKLYLLNLLIKYSESQVEVCQPAQKRMKIILKWLLIISVTLISTTMLLFLAQFLAILPLSASFYETSIANVLQFSNVFNIFHIILTPLLFKAMEKQYLLFIIGSVLIMGVGLIMRSLAEQSYIWALIGSILVGISHIPIISAPYGMLKMFPQNHRGYASSIPLFVPGLGINIAILYAMFFISKEEYSQQRKFEQITLFSWYITILGICSLITTIILIIILKNDILKVRNQDQNGEILKQPNEATQLINSLKISRLFRKFPVFCIQLICWGSLLGFNWTFGALFGVIFGAKNDPSSEEKSVPIFTQTQIEIIGLAANLSTVILSNLGTWILNTFQLKPISIINFLTICGALTFCLITVNSMVQFDFMESVTIVSICTIILRAGFSSFVAIAFLILGKSGVPQVYTSNIIFWIANLVNLVTMEMLGYIDRRTCLVVMLVLIGLCVYGGGRDQQQQFCMQTRIQESQSIAVKETSSDDIQTKQMT